MPHPTSWICPNCRRRVPRYAAVCHCGTRQAEAGDIQSEPAELARPRAGGWRQLPLSVWLPLAIAAVAAIALLALLFLPPEPSLGIPLLGRVERIPTPRPKR
jgi:hypothetical protein